MMDLFTALGGDASLTILLGAGASAPSGLPSWDDFALSATLESGLISDKRAARTLLKLQDPTIVLEAARSHSSTDWRNLLVRCLYGSTPMTANPSPLHLAAAGHFLEFPDTTVLATLNYDLLLEEALSSDTRGVHSSSDGIPNPNLTNVFHLHGHLPLNADDLPGVDPIVTFSDYANLVAASNPWQQQFLQDAVRHGPLLLAGTSYRDPDIRHWLHLIRLDQTFDFPILVTIAREGLNLDRDTFAILEQALTSHWRAIGLTALVLHDLSDIALIIRELKHVGDEGYVPPQRRIFSIWAAHEQSFAKLQSSYSDFLELDLSNISKALDAPAHRATLWLADAQGFLVRWATSDGSFRSSGSLKRVPTGHDSPWIAGEALGAEEIILRDVSRDPDVSPTWSSVLAIPIFTSDGAHPAVATAVVTFGLEMNVGALLDGDDDWLLEAEKISREWGIRLSENSAPCIDV